MLFKAIKQPAGSTPSGISFVSLADEIDPLFIRQDQVP